MFIFYKIQDELVLASQKYTQNLELTVKNAIMAKYLFKINKLGLCTKIKSIEIVDNVILRKEAQMCVKVNIQLLILKFVEGEFFTGAVVEVEPIISSTKGIIISFMEGLMECRIVLENLHEDTLFNGKYILPFGKDKAFTWEVGAQVRFKIHRCEWENRSATRMADLVSGKCNQQGLGPISWWI